MGKEPLVVAVMLVNGRPGMVKRSIECLNRQTYKNRKLLVYDTTSESDIIAQDFNPYAEPCPLGTLFRQVQDAGRNIGHLRNKANDIAVKSMGADVIAHWDSDDWSHPERLADQVDLWQYVDTPIVGYHSMPFYDERHGEAWMYRNPFERFALGTSLLYRSKVWSRTPFPDVPHGEDTQWLAGQQCFSISALGGAIKATQSRIVALIHHGNTSPAYRYEVMLANEAQGDVWRRTPDQDKVLKELFR